MNSFEKYIVNYRRFTHFPRTASEAYKDADYATAIWRCETENEKGLQKLFSWLIPIALIAAFIFIAVPTFEWIINR